MYGTATFIKVNQLRYDSFSQKYLGTSVQVLIAFKGKVFLLVKALVFLLLLLLWIFMFLFCLVFAMFLCASVYMCFVVTCWERADLLALVCGVY